ncbi:MAG: M48 family metalloprotease [Proteobacteria bacterium]|nr:M48 family metalloprotease [Pseudomonadota bacterium]
MKFRLRGLLFGLLGLLALPALSACETAPGTGRTIFTGGMGPETEARLGYQEHQKIVPQFGGAYADPAIDAYVTGIGDLLVKTSETPDLKFTFTVLDTPMVNAFALPGGYVYITRGLLALADNEAEVAGVLAHEIGHVTARHSAERYGQTMAANILGLGLGILLGSGPVTDLYGAVAGVALRSYSREQEYESDLLGVRYMSRAGYDPGAMATFLTRLLAHGRLEAELRGQPGKADAFDIMQTHPRTADRIARAIAEAGAKTVAEPMTAREVYLGKIDGLLYGDDPEQGFVRGRRFLHPELRFAFEVPRGFRLFNGIKRVRAQGPEGAAIVFGRAKKPSRAPMTVYLTQVWAEGVRLREVERLTINGMEAATGHTRMNARSGPVDVRLVAIRYDAANIYRMLFLTPPKATGPLQRALRETTYSFRKLSAAEAAALKPLRLGIHRVRPGETAAVIAERMPFADYRLRRFLVLNGLTEGTELSVGQKVKVVTE